MPLIDQADRSVGHFRSRLTGEIPDSHRAALIRATTRVTLPEYVAVSEREYLAPGVGRGELAIGGGPDSRNAAAGGQKKSGRSQCHKRHQQTVFDQILSLIVV